MYAVALTGGKQYRVAVDDIIKVEKVDLEDGAKIKLDTILVNKDGKLSTGNPIKGAYVEAEVLRSGRSKKIIVFTYKAKKNVKKKQGHRQGFSMLKITNIVAK